MSKNSFRGFISLIIVVILVAGVCLMGFASRNDDGKWFGNFTNVSSWHWSDNTDGNDDDDDGDLDVTQGEAYGIALLDGDIEVGTADNVRTLTAQVTDAITGEALDELQEVEFSMDWKDGEYQGWYADTSTDIDDYVTMEVDGMTAIFTCLKPFSTPITVTCRSIQKPSKYATAQLDYLKPVWLKRGSAASVAVGGTADYTIGYAAKYSELDTTKNISLFSDIDYNVWGTRSYWTKENVQYCSAVNIAFTQEFKNYVTEQMGWSGFYMPYLKTNSGGQDMTQHFTVSEKDLLTMASNIGDRCGEFMQLFNKYEGPELVVSFGDRTTYNSKHEEINLTFNYYLNLSIAAIVGDVNVDNPSIDFGG